MGFQFATPLNLFTSPEWNLREPEQEAPEDNDSDIGLTACTTSGSGPGNIGTFDKTANSAGLTIGDMLENLHDAMNDYGDQVTANLPGQGSVSLTDLMDPGGVFINVMSGNLNSTGRLDPGMSSSFLVLTLDFAEIEAQATNSNGSGTVLRETYVTFFHELGHNLIGVGVPTDEFALDDFAMDLLNELEKKAVENNDNPYDNEECPIE